MQCQLSTKHSCGCARCLGGGAAALTLMAQQEEQQSKLSFVAIIKAMKANRSRKFTKVAQNVICSKPTKQEQKRQQAADAAARQQQSDNDSNSSEAAASEFSRCDSSCYDFVEDDRAVVTRDQDSLHLDGKFRPRRWNGGTKRKQYMGNSRKCVEGRPWMMFRSERIMEPRDERYRIRKHPCRLRMRPMFTRNSRGARSNNNTKTGNTVASSNAVDIIFRVITFGMDDSFFAKKMRNRNLVQWYHY